MKGFIYNGAGSIELREIPLAPCGDNDIIIKNIYAGVCGSDITAYKVSGDFMRLYPGSEFGHEMVGEVVECGKNVEGLSIGDRVYPYPLFAKDDTKRSGSVGGFSEFVHIPNCRLNHSVYKLDDRISSRVGAMLEPFSVGGRAALLSDPGKGKNAIIYGAGFIGISVAITLKHLGCDQVLMVDFSEFRLEIAKKLGFLVCNPQKQDVYELAAEAFGTAFGIMGLTANADIYVDAIGIPAPLEDFQRHGKLNAVYTIVGLGPRPLTVNAQPLVHSSHRIQGSGGYNEESLRVAMDIMLSGKYDLDSLITQEYPHEKLDEAIHMAMNPSESLKVLIKY